MADPEAFADAMRRGIDAMRTDLKELKAEKRVTKVTCSYCGKASATGKLDKCSMCRAARYCNRDCQAAHFKAGHKSACASFAEPPFTHTFDTLNYPGTKYPRNPIFAKTHENGFGCWISVGGPVDCSLQNLMDKTDGFPGRQQEEVYSDAMASKLAQATPLLHNILTLRVLVQNRRKDKQQVLVFGGRAIVTGTEYSSPLLKKWAMPGDEVHDLPMPGRGRNPNAIMAGVATLKDPWGVRRVSVLSVNGIENPGSATIPRPSRAPSSAPLNKILDPSYGMVALGFGDYAVLELQFRCGDGKDVSDTYLALEHLSGLMIPLSLWDGKTSASDAFMQLMFSGLMSDKSGTFSLFAVFDGKAIKEYYADYVNKGPQEFIRTHYGQERMEMTSEADKMHESTVRMIVQMAKSKPGGLEAFQERLRMMGRPDLAESLASL